MLNPELTEDDIAAFSSGACARTACVPARLRRDVASVETSIRGLQIATPVSITRKIAAIAESVRLGRLMAERVA